MGRLLKNRNYILLNSIVSIFVILIAVFYFLPFSVLAQTKYEYSYTGAYQEFECPKDGIYKIQLWGAQGGNYDATLFGGLGGYTEGIVKIKKGEKLYFYVGGQPSSSETNYIGGWNGGGNVPTDKDKDGRAGGGATDVRTVPTTAKDTWFVADSLASRIMVAGGGGGAAYENKAAWRSDGGPSGGLLGYNPQSMGSSASQQYGTGATQIAGGYAVNASTTAVAIGVFGRGGQGISTDGGSGGGGGWFGGGGSNICSGGGGGSSYISGHSGCIAVDQSGSSLSTASSTNTSYSWTGFVFQNTKLVDGLGYSWTDSKGAISNQPTHDNEATQKGNSGNGFARIEALRELYTDNTLKNITSNKGEFMPTFDPDKDEYDLILDTYDGEVELFAEANEEHATVGGTGLYSLRYKEIKSIDLVVTSESGDVRVYTVHIKRKGLSDGVHSNELAELDLFDEENENYLLDPEFHRTNNNYFIDIGYNTLEVKVKTIAYDDEATVKVEGNDLILTQEGDIKITISVPGLADNVYTIHYKKGELSEEVYDYSYTGDYQTFIAPSRGRYKIELWGSQGADGAKAGGLGAYTKGDLLLNKNERLYIYVGNRVTHNYSFNGGAYGKTQGISGGGATDVRLTPGTWNDFDSLKSRLMVAAGGGGGDNWSGASYGGAAGGLSSYDSPYYATGGWGTTLATGATQTVGGHGFISTDSIARHGVSGTFGTGGDGHLSSGYGGGGGGGYYGGGGGGDGGPMTTGGTGGSSYISGHPGCNSILENSVTNQIQHSGSEIHYSNKKFTNTVMIDGMGYSWISASSYPRFTANTSNGGHVVMGEGEVTGQPTPTGDTATGHEGDGYARITPLFLKSENNYLSDIVTSTGTLSPSFSSTVYEYDLVLDKEEREVDIEGILSDETASIVGNGHYKVKYGQVLKVELIVTSESGDLRTYIVNVKRSELALGEHSSKIADLDFVVEADDVAPVFDPIFNSNVFEYHIILPPNMIYLDFDVVLFDDEATFTKEGTGILLHETGEFVITVKEPHSDDSVYKVIYSRDEMPDEEYSYNYTGDYQTFVAPSRGWYRFELWGSQGATSTRKAGGLGAYTKGDIFLEKNEKLYIYVGNSELHSISFNGGAIGRSNGHGGGGATDIRLTPGKWNDFTSLKSRIMVAAGGGGAENWTNGSEGGAGGGLYSYDVPYFSNGSWAYTLNTGATQTAGGVGMVGRYQNGTNGSFGFGGAGGNTYGGGGGGGYYGGSGGGDGGPMTSAGSGGSSYISGHPGCNSISESSTSNNIIHSESDIHYSTKRFRNTVMIDGLGYSWVGADSNPNYTANSGKGIHATLDSGDFTGQPTIDGNSIQTGREGLGYAKVTPLFKSKNNYLLNLESNYGTFDKEFSPFETEYTLTLDKYEQHFTLTGEAADKEAVVVGLGKYQMHLGQTKIIDIDVTAPNGDVRTYRIKVIRGNLEDDEHSTKLVSLKINNDKFALNPEFISIVTNYQLEVPYSTIALDVDAVPYDKEANIKIEGNGYLNKEGENVVLITVTHPEVEETIYKIVITREADVEGEISKFTCTNGYQKFVAPGSTYYRTQLWGASGGFGRTDWALRYRGGLGAYTDGEIYLSKGQEIYVYVGCRGEDGGTTLSHVGGAGGFNGGAKGGDDANRDSAPEPGGGGGGATDIRLTPTSKVSTWNEFDSLKSRIMVAAGGGGGTYYGIGGAGGTLSGLAGYGNKTLPNQTGGYGFGYGMPGIAANIGSGGAGGGYFGGYSATNYAGGGGSSFVSGCEDCVAVDQNSTINNITMSGLNKHYSNYVFDKIEMASGEESQPNPDGGYQVGNTGDGYAIITASKGRSENNFLSSLTVSKGTLSPEFDVLNRVYTVDVEPDDTTITIDATPDDLDAVVAGTGTFDVEAGENVFSIFVTAESGDIRVYEVHVNREKSSNARPISIDITGLVPNLCALKDEYCNLTPEFDPDTNEYTLTVPSKIKQLEFEVNRANRYQTVVGDGITLLEEGENTIEIEVTSEDESSTIKYTYKVIRDASGNNNIEDLVVVNPTVDIGFDPDVSDYYFSVPDGTENLELEITLEDSQANYEVLGNENFVDGVNIVQVVVTAQNGDAKTYTLNVYLEQSGNTFISEIKVNHDDTNYALNPTYNKIISNYIVHVPNEVDQVTITATPEHALTTVTGVGDKNLVTGTNKVNLISTAQDGSMQIYELYIIRAKSSDATLKSLDVLEGSLDPEFDSQTFEYTIDVNSGVTSLTLNPVVSNSKSKYKISGNSGFQLGMNKVVILVTAEDGTQQSYILNVNRIASSNNYLSTLIIDKYDMTGIFNKETEVYDIEFEDKIPTIRVSATPEDKNAKVSKTGIYNIKTGSNEINIIVTAEDGSTRTYTVNIFQKGNKNNNLISLTTSSTASLSPAFNKDTTKYQLDVLNNEDEITVIGVAEDSKARVTGNGTYHLNTGNNVIELVVTAEDGNEKTYEITVNRKKSSNANISLIIAKESVLDPLFDKDKTEYVLKVLEEVMSLQLTVDLEDFNATYEVIGNENFQIGHNTVTIRVTAEDGTIKDYVLDVLRQETGTTSDKLESLTVSEGELVPSFDPEVIYYEVEVSHDVDKITLEAIAEDKNATVEGTGEYALKFGQNVLGVSVTSTEGVVRSYQVVVTRKRREEARLASLRVNDSTLDPNFDKDTYEYSLKTNDTSLVIKAVPLDSSATFKIIGNQNFEVGNNDIIVRVTAQDGQTTKDYVLHVEKEKSLNNNLKLLEIDSVSITPEFSKTTTVYTATVDRDVNNILINAEAEDSKATVAGDGTVNLDMGVNYINVIVTSEAGTEKVYTLIVTREGNDNYFLSSLMTSSGTLSPEFNKEVNDYTVEVDYDVEDIVITGTPEDSLAIVTGLQKYPLEVGDNQIAVTVTAESGSINTYHILVTRKNLVSSKLKNITVDNYRLEEEFSPDLYDYTLNVDYEVQSLNLHIETIDQNATYEVFGNSDFSVGMNTITIVVTDSLGEEKSTYTLNVNRNNYSNNFLSYIYSSEGKLSPDFSKEVLSYTVEVESDVDAIDIYAEPEILSNTLVGTGHYELQSGSNLVTLTVTSSNGIKRIYYVDVVRKMDASNDLESLVVKTNDEVQKLNPQFNKSTLEYNVEVNEGVSSVSILATASHNASISGIGTKAISVGNNKFDISVTSESGDVKVYTVNVMRKASGNNNLLSITPNVGNLDPVFSSDQLEYSLVLDAGHSMLSFSVVTEDRFAQVTGTDLMLIPDGVSTRIIKVVAENGDEKTYKINVYKDRTDEARLSSLAIDGYSFNEEFDPDVFNYTITVPNSYEVLLASDVNAVALDSRASINKVSSLVLSTKDVNIYTIIVTAKDGFTKQTYTISITREKGNDSTLASLNFKYGTLTPIFASDNTEYTLVLPKDVTQISKEDVEAIATDSDAIVTIPDTYDFDDEHDTYEIKVESADGKSTTIYTIHLKPEPSGNNLLTSLSINPGILEPSFDANVNEYTVSLSEDVKEVEITATSDVTATITGNGKQSVKSGENRYEIVVTAEDGTVNTYVIIATRAKSTNTNVSNIIPSAGSLSPEYSNDVGIYEVEVEEEIDTIDFDVILESDEAVVSGDKNNSLNYGENDIVITVTAEDGTVKNIIIKVIRNKKITDISLDDTLLMEVGDIVTLNPVIIPSDATNQELIYESEDDSVIKVDDGIVSALKLGNTTITVSSKKYPDIKKVVSVEVLNLHITSNTYEVRRNGEDFPYIIGAEQGIVLSEFVTNLDNRPELIHFYLVDGTELTDVSNEKVKTGYIVKLEHNRKVYDELYIAVRGDVNGDGEINVKDYNEVVNHTLKKKLLENYFFAVSNVDDEVGGIINVKDSNKIQNKVLKKISSLNP